MLNKIRSKFLLQVIFKNLKNRLLLNIVKYNKKLSNNLNIEQKDFKNYKYLKEMNDIFGTKIKDIESENLKLKRKEINNYSLELITKIEFNNLKELNLSENEISDITVLEKVNFKKLEILNLNYNKLENINILKIVKFKELKELHLYHNKISDINVLEKDNFPK